MANNELYFKSMAELEALAATYKTTPNLSIIETADPIYTIADISKTEFNNITNFLYHATVKSTDMIEEGENIYSREFSKYMLKYYNDELTPGDVVALKKFVDKYNALAESYIKNNIYEYVYGVSSESDGINSTGFYGKLILFFKTRFQYLVNNYPNQTEKKTVFEWYGKTGTDPNPTKKITINDFFKSHFLRSNLIEGQVLLSIDKYIETKHSDDVVDMDLELSKDSIGGSYSIENGTSEILRLQYKNDTNDFFSFIDGEGINKDTLLANIKEHLNGFLTIFETPVTQIGKDYKSALDLYINGSLNTDIVNIYNTTLYKDKILAHSRITTNIEESTGSSIFEGTLARSMEPLLFIDVRGMSFKSSPHLDEAKRLFEADDLGRTTVSSEVSGTVENKLTYTVLYKELNPIIREIMLGDVIEYVMSRLFITNFESDLETLLAVDREGVSFFYSVNELLRTYIDDTILFKLPELLNRYKFLFSNPYIIRNAEESDIIAYYLGDNTVASSFLNNYGYREYEKIEIDNFLTMYKTTRDYYYQVLRNDSFIHDDYYFLYERLMISWIAIERFLSSKISNLRDADYLNDTDIYNFLESYGLGILNTHSFFLGAKDYKTNIIKNFAKLIKNKGSKDIIPLLLKVFEVDDVDVEINKYLLLDESEGEESLNVSKEGLKLTKDGNSIDGYSLKVGETILETGTETPLRARDTLNNIRGEFYKLTDKDTIFERITNGWDTLVVKRYIPTVIIQNEGLDIPSDSDVWKALNRYNGCYFFVGDILQKYNSVMNSLETETLTKVSKLPVESLRESVTFEDLLGEFSEFDGEDGTVIITLDGGQHSFSVHRKENLTKIPLDKEFSIKIIRNQVSESKLRFVEVPYTSDNTLRDIMGKRKAAQGYETFLTESDQPKDIYWTTETVPESLLQETGLNVVETKYLSLTLSENMYRSYAMSRFMLSTIQYLERFVLAGSEVIEKIKIDTGSELFDEISLKNYFEIIKYEFLALLKVYGKINEVDDPININVGNYYHYGVNPDGLTEVETLLKSFGISGTLFEDNVFIGTSPTGNSFGKYSLFKKDSTIKEDYSKVSGDKKRQYEVETAELTDDASLINDIIFSTHKNLNSGEQDNSGEYVLNLLENLNPIKILSNEVVGTITTITGSELLWDYYLSKFKDNQAQINTERNNGHPDGLGLYYEIIEKIMTFPMQYLDGLLSPSYVSENINRNKQFVDLMKTIFENVYMVESEDGKDPIFDDVTVPEGYEEVLSDFMAVMDNGFDPEIEELQTIQEDLLERFLLTIDALQSIFASEEYMNFSFSIGGEESRTLQFVETAVTLFISYTSQLYSSSFKRKYDTISETVPYAEDIHHSLHTLKQDMFFYDEELSIEKEGE